MRDCHTRRYPQVVVIQCFFVVMAMLLLVERICLEDAAFHLWMKYLTSRFLQASLTLCFSEVMAAFRRAEAIVNDSATFHRSNPAISTSVTQCRLAETSSCNFMLFVKLIHTFWHVPIWLARHYYASMRLALAWLQIHRSTLHRAWRSSWTVFE